MISQLGNIIPPWNKARCFLVPTNQTSRQTSDLSELAHWFMSFIWICGYYHGMAYFCNQSYTKYLATSFSSMKRNHTAYSGCTSEVHCIMHIKVVKVCSIAQAKCEDIAKINTPTVHKINQLPKILNNSTIYSCKDGRATFSIKVAHLTFLADCGYFSSVRWHKHGTDGLHIKEETVSFYHPSCSSVLMLT